MYFDKVFKLFIALHKYSVYFFFHFEILFLESLLFYYIYFIMDCCFFLFLLCK